MGEESIFSLSGEEMNFEAPLAERMRPRTLDEYAGQRHLLGKGMALRNLLEGGRVPSCILYGPPGVGKTTLVRLMARVTKRTLLEINAVSAKVETLRDLVERARREKGLSGRAAIAFVDEIYHFNSRQQNVLLPAVETGDLILVGTTTENPWFEINKTLLSRMVVYTLEPLSADDLCALLKRAMADGERGVARLGVSADDAVLRRIAELAGGDARQALTRLEAAASAAAMGGGSALTEEIVAQSSGAATQRYDRNANDHYAVISALIKSMRGSDPDAALHYLARLLEAGDLPGACRRILCSASEDIGMAYPQAVSIVKACVDNALQLGLPEAQLPLAQACILLATAPKSNSVVAAIDAARADVRAGKSGNIPREMQNVHADGTGFEREQGYKYPHNYPGHWVRQQYLPDSLKNAHYYEYGDNKTEQAAKRYWEEIKR